MTQEEIFEKIKELLLDVDSSLKIEPESSMREDLELDSTDVISFFFELETAFDIKIPDSDLEDNSLDKISDIVGYISKKISP